MRLVVTLSSEQEDRADTLVNWVRATISPGAGSSGGRGMRGGFDARVRALRGLAGTGKTVTGAEIARRLTVLGYRVAVVAPTGKAAHVLRGKGVPATTIHAAVYVLVADGPDGPEFALRRDVEGEPDVVICDEASMATGAQVDDMLSRVPLVILVGDPGQLPPVSGQAVLADAYGVELTEVHRQALDSGVVRFAHAIRHGASVADALRAGAPDVVAARPPHLVGVVLVARNDQRVRLNRGIREQVHAVRRGGRPGAHTLPDHVIEGDRLVCLSNHRGPKRPPPGDPGPWCNGTVCDVVWAAAGRPRGIDDLRGFRGVCDDGAERHASTWTRQLAAPGLLSVDDEDDRERREARYAFGWALTTHKAQGSEWPEVVVVGDGFGTPEEVRQWRYTAATRASRKLWWTT